MFTIITTTSARFPRLLTVSCTLSLYSASWQNLTQFSALPLHSSTILSIALSGSSVNSKVLFTVIYFLKYSLSLSCLLNPFKEWFIYFFSHPVSVRTRKWGWILFQNLLLLGNHPFASIGVAEEEKKQPHGESSFEKVQTTIPKKLRRSHVSFQSSVHFSTSLYSKLAKLLPILNYPHSCFWKKESA